MAHGQRRAPMPMLLWFPWIVWSGLLTLPDQRRRGE
jgi:hypothetical protein